MLAAATSNPGATPTMTTTLAVVVAVLFATGVRGNPWPQAKVTAVPSPPGPGIEIPAPADGALSAGSAAAAAPSISASKDGQVAAGARDSRPLESLGNLLNGILNGASVVIRGVTAAAQDVVENRQQISERVSGAIEATVNTSAQLASAGTEVVQSAPTILREKSQFVDGLVKTLNETQGFFKGSLDELEAGSKLVSTLAGAFTETALKRIDNFLEVFDKRLRCNVECSKLTEGSDQRSKCEDKFCVKTLEDLGALGGNPGAGGHEAKKPLQYTYEYEDYGGDGDKDE